MGQASATGQNSEQLQLYLQQRNSSSSSNSNAMSYAERQTQHQHRRAALTTTWCRRAPRVRLPAAPLSAARSSIFKSILSRQPAAHLAIGRRLRSEARLQTRTAEEHSPPPLRADWAGPLPGPLSFGAARAAGLPAAGGRRAGGAPPGVRGARPAARRVPCCKRGAAASSILVASVAGCVLRQPLPDHRVL
jgi:hypothetical protein